MSVEVKRITEHTAALGEGPHWDERVQALYFVSILDKALHKYVPATGEHTKTTVDGRVGFIVPLDGSTSQFVVGIERRLVVVQWDGSEGSPVKTLRVLGEVDHGTKNRLNDGKADPKGRLFAGTMGHEEPIGNIEKNCGSLFRADGSNITKMVDKVSISNGLAWSLEEKAFYYIDSPERKVRRYDYDVDTGNISNMKYIFDFEVNNLSGVPDGMTIDTEGNLWIAVWEGSCVIKVDPRSGKLLQKIPIPALQVTSVTFGGPNMDILFVTTASLPIKGEQKPPCGATFMILGLGVKGLKNATVKL